VTLNGGTIRFDRVTAANALRVNGGTLHSSNGWGAIWSGPVTVNATATLNCNYKLTLSGAISGAGDFTKTGSATLIFSGENTSSGTIHVQTGRVAYQRRVSMGSGPLRINSGAAVDLNYTGTCYLVSLTLNGVTQPIGTYGSTASNATHRNDTWFAGPGTLTVSGLPDYQSWAGNYPGSDLTDPDGDADGDGLANREEWIWGLNPTSGSHASATPTVVDPASGSFSYTRRDDALTGLNYTIWYSTDLANWFRDTGAQQVSGDPDANHVETVVFTLSPQLQTEPRFYVRVQAVE
jgi:autotransporter-associated beta strand protein